METSVELGTDRNPVWATAEGKASHGVYEGDALAGGDGSEADALGAGAVGAGRRLVTAHVDPFFEAFRL